MRRTIAIVAAILLAGCGGGSDSGAPGGSSAAAPTITSAATATVTENTAGTIYQATATDAGGRSVTFRIEGADAARFALSSTGALSFVAAPDYEAPTDANTDNVYEIALIASNGGARRPD